MERSEDQLVCSKWNRSHEVTQPVHCGWQQLVTWRAHTNGDHTSAGIIRRRKNHYGGVRAAWWKCKSTVLFGLVRDRIFLCSDDVSRPWNVLPLVLRRSGRVSSGLHAAVTHLVSPPGHQRAAVGAGATASVWLGELARSPESGE